MINYVKAAWRLGWFQVPGWLVFLALQQLALVEVLGMLEPGGKGHMGVGLFLNMIAGIVEILLWINVRPTLLHMLDVLEDEAQKIEYEEATIKKQQGQLSIYDKPGQE